MQRRKRTREKGVKGKGRSMFKGMRIIGRRRSNVKGKREERVEGNNN